MHGYVLVEMCNARLFCSASVTNSLVDLRDSLCAVSEHTLKQIKSHVPALTVTLAGKQCGHPRGTYVVMLH